MSDISELAKALVAFQADVPVIEKKRTAKVAMKNGGTYSYTYADLGDIWAAVRPVLAKHKLAVTQLMVGGSEGHTGIKTTVWHETGQHIEEVMDVPTQGKTAQEAGSLFTYYKRYALGAALGLSTEDDDDGQAGNSKPSASYQRKPAASNSDGPSDAQRDLIATLAKKLGYSSGQITATQKKVTTKREASEFIDKLQVLADKKKVDQTLDVDSEFSADEFPGEAS